MALLVYPSSVDEFLLEAAAGEIIGKRGAYLFREVRDRGSQADPEAGSVATLLASLRSVHDKRRMELPSWRALG